MNTVLGLYLLGILTMGQAVSHEKAWEDMAQQAEAISAVSGTTTGYCGEGECYQPDAVTHEHEMGNAVLALESTFGGEKTGGDSADVRIYTGKREICQHDNWKFADCCTDEGWGLNANLTKCPAETQILGQQKAAGQCHHVGHYDEKIRVGGVVVKIIDYETYCCFPSKLATITQVSGRAQLGKRWGYKKYTDCEGFTTDEFARIRFDQIDFEGAFK